MTDLTREILERAEDAYNKALEENRRQNKAITNIRNKPDATQKPKKRFCRR